MFKHLIFDNVGCTPGLRALKAYKREWDRDNKVFRDKPAHDWASNFADSFRYLCLVAKLNTTPIQTKDERQRIGLYSFTLDQAWECRGGSGGGIRY
jgi:hypothetical protein